MTYPLWIIPVLPLAGFLVNGLVALVAGWQRAAGRTAAWRQAHPDDGHGDHGHGHSHGGHDHGDHGDHGHGSHDDHGGPALPYWQRLFHGIVGVGSTGLSCVLALGVVVPYVKASLAAPEGIPPVVEVAYRWMAAGIYTVDIAFRLDALSALMLSFVTFVGALIHLYSVGYMQDEEGFGRFFAYLNLFMFSMLILVMADSLPMLFIGWEGVGLCSYLLIGYYYDKDFAAAAGKKAFVTNAFFPAAAAKSLS